MENLLNGCPLTHVSIDPTDPKAITPNHLLCGHGKLIVPMDWFTEAELTSKKRWEIVQATAEHFWRRWMREYLPCLTERRIWLTVIVFLTSTLARPEVIGRSSVCWRPDNIVRSAIVHVRNDWALSAGRGTLSFRGLEQKGCVDASVFFLRPVLDPKPDAGPAMFPEPCQREKRLRPSDGSWTSWT